MKQYTNESQTAKLIELGFDKPRIDAGVTKWEGYEPICTGSYTIGELIEMLPKHIFPDGACSDLQILANQNLWVVKYTALFYEEYYRFCSKELIDAAFAMIVKLKEDGVI